MSSTQERNLFSPDEFMKRIKESRNLNNILSKNSETTYQRNNNKKIKTFNITDNNGKLNKFLHNKLLIDGIFDENKINIIKKQEKIFPYSENKNSFLTNRLKKNTRTQSNERKNYYKIFYNQKNEKKEI